jgi:hypothetical protein
MGFNTDNPMLTQEWIDVNVELPPDGWVGKILVRVPGQGVVEKQCLMFRKKSPTGVENDFTYQHGILEGRTGTITPPSTVTHWLKLVDRE